MIKEPMHTTIRKAVDTDLQAITDIYNEAILNTTATFDTETKTVDQRKEWFKQHNDTYMVMVAESGQKITGWASLSRWSDRCAYDSTAELSVYVKDDERGKGVGKLLMTAVIEAGRLAGLHTVLSRISEGNEISIRMHEQAGFSHIGIMKEVGKKFGKLLDVYMMQKIYGPEGDWKSVR